MRIEKAATLMAVVLFLSAVTGYIAGDADAGWWPGYSCDLAG